MNNRLDFILFYFIFLILFYFIFEFSFLFFILNLGRSVCVISHVMVIIILLGNTRKVIEDSEIDNIIQHNNNILVL